MTKRLIDAAQAVLQDYELMDDGHMPYSPDLAGELQAAIAEARQPVTVTPEAGCAQYHRQYSDQMQCSKCLLVWDMNDPHPPTCKEQHQ